MKGADAAEAISRVMGERLGEGGVLLVAYRGDW